MKKVWILILLVILLVAGGIGFMRVKAFFQKPLAAPLAVLVQSTPTQVVLATSAPVVAAVAPTSTPEPVVATLAPTCGQSGVMTVLLLARDVANGEPPYGADLIRFVRIDFDNQAVRLIAVPRDLWVATPHLAPLNVDHSRLGPVYYLQEQASTGTSDQIATTATGAVAQALYDNYGVAADHYLFLEMRFFAQALDQLGGLDVNIPTAITVGGDTFLTGQQHLDGTRALLYARLLPTSSELDGGWARLDRQNLILKALVSTALTPANVLKLPGLLAQFQNDFTTDLSPEQITNLTCLAGKVTSDQITSVQVEKTMITGPGPDNSMLADTTQVTQFLQKQLAP